MPYHCPVRKTNKSLPFLFAFPLWPMTREPENAFLDPHSLQTPE